MTPGVTEPVDLKSMFYYTDEKQNISSLFYYTDEDPSLVKHIPSSLTITVTTECLTQKLGILVPTKMKVSWF